MSVFSGLCTSIQDFGTLKSNPRTEKISKITIHHMAGVSSGINCAKAHLSGDRQASANYYIGVDGDICGGVSETRRAWTSASAWNDQRSITIEVSNSRAATPWPVSDKAYDALIRLCADICSRYGIAPHFSGTKDGTLTAHYMYAATACPGDTLKDLLKCGVIEDDIKKALSGLPKQSEAPLSDEERIWDYLISKIGNAYGVAGLMGNLYAESGLKSNNLQNSFEKKLGLTDLQYTEAVDSGAYSRDRFIRDGAGYGLAQWTFWNRKENLYNFKGSRSISDLDMQLDFLWDELSHGYKGILQALLSARTVYDASTIVLTQFERPADQSEAMKQKRAAYGQAYYDRYAGTPSGGYLVRVTADELNVRKGPGTNFGINTVIHKGEVYTITQEAGNWGHLKSGAGWINLRYTKRL